MAVTMEDGPSKNCAIIRADAQPNVFSSWLRPLFRQDWVVYCKRPFGGPEHALRYLGSYTHRVAISNHRLVSLADDQVTFRWRDSAHQNKRRLMTLPVDEFLRRFLLRLLPRGFVRIRNFGFLPTAGALYCCHSVLATASGTITAGVGIDHLSVGYTQTVFADPFNTWCAGYLDFTYVF